MTFIPWRGILFYSFVAFFAVASVLLILYGTGYRYSSSKRTLEKTGELIMESQPKGASVFIDGKDTEKKAPIHLKYILPGTYRLTITKDGYLPFYREISISSGMVTIVNDVVLVKDLVPVLLFSHPDGIEEISGVTPQSIFFKAEKSFFVYEREKKQTKELVRTGTTTNAISSDNSPSFYIYSGTQAFIIEKESEKVRKVHPPPADMHSFVWTKSQELFGVTPAGIIAFDPSSSKIEYIAKGVFHDFLIEDSLVTTIEERDDIFFIMQLDRADKKKKAYVREVKKNARRFVKDVYPYMILRSDEGEFFTLPEAKRALSAPIKEIQRFVFPSALDIRVAASDYEIWLFEDWMTDKNKRLLLRRADPIIRATLIPTAPYVLVRGRDILELLEISNQPTPNRYEIMRSEKIRDSVFYPKEGKLFITLSDIAGSSVYERLLIE